ncbi:hypothetical protein ACGFMK_39700 [Amycolatopsis sp. NPDC049252]
MRTSREERSKSDDGEPTPIFDAVASAARKGAGETTNPGKPSGDGKAGR